MHRYVWIILCLVLVACDGTSPQFRDATRAVATVDGVTYNLFIMGNEIEALKVSGTPPLKTKLSMDMGIRAMERASGCTVRSGSVSGDVILLRATLICPKPQE